MTNGASREKLEVTNCDLQKRLSYLGLSGIFLIGIDVCHSFFEEK